MGSQCDHSNELCESRGRKQAIKRASKHTQTYIPTKKKTNIVCTATHSFNRHDIPAVAVADAVADSQEDQKWWVAIHGDKLSYKSTTVIP